jgi:hypothetical protein
MKKIEANRYPHSSTLFKFCKEALEIRYEGNVKVIDQDVGAILGYDPADCSHWKKGKKNIRALSTLKTIADHLNIDERLLIDIASGRVDLDEAVFEYKGYGNTSLLGRHLETLKKEFFKNPARWNSDGSKSSFENLFTIDRDSITEIVTKILSQGDFAEAPIYLPEIVKMFPNIRIESIETAEKAFEVLVENREDGASSTIIRIKTGEVRPYMRYLMARELYKHLIRNADPLVAKFKDTPEEIVNIQSNIFASMLLIPTAMLKHEVEKIDTSLDIIAQLADVFWVSKSLMNQRMRDYMDSLI